jgi:hypothetical protein
MLMEIIASLSTPLLLVDHFLGMGVIICECMIHIGYTQLKRLSKFSRRKIASPFLDLLMNIEDRYPTSSNAWLSVQQIISDDSRMVWIHHSRIPISRHVSWYGGYAYTCFRSVGFPFQSLGRPAHLLLTPAATPPKGWVILVEQLGQSSQEMGVLPDCSDCGLHPLH